MFENTVRKVIPTYGYTAPTEAEVLWELSQTKFTPDIARLEQYEWQLLFVVDELKKDHIKHDLLGVERALKFPGYTQKPFRFWMPNDPTMSPIPTETSEGHNVLNNIVGWPPAVKIKGELWKIRSQQFITLDTYKQNTVQFSRKMVRIIVPHRAVVWLKDHNLDPEFGVQDPTARRDYSGSSIKHSKEIVTIIRCWMYVAKPTFWDPIITAYDFSPVETFQTDRRRWLDQYYHIRRPNLLK